MNLAARQVFLGSEPVEISWRQFEALRLLIEAGGRPVEREKLLEALWPGVTVEEASLNQCISQLRKVLNDTPETGIILTVPRLGYRLGAFMSPDELQPGVAVEPVANAEGSRGGNWRVRRWAAVALLLALLAGGGWVGRRALRTARAEALASEGIALVRQNQQPKVAAGNELLRQAMDLSPNLAIAYAGLAEGMVRSGESLPGQAKGMALRSVQLAPDCGACLATAGWVLMSREWQWEEALDYLSRAARFTPDDGRIRLWHAQILAVNGNLDAALREADRAIELQPGEVAAITMRAGILYLQQRYEEAIFSARKALAIQPTHTSTMVWLYRAYGRQRRFAEALSLLSSARRHFTGMSADQEYSLTPVGRLARDTGHRGLGSEAIGGGIRPSDPGHDAVRARDLAIVDRRPQWSSARTRRALFGASLRLDVSGGRPCLHGTPRRPSLPERRPTDGAAAQPVAGSRPRARSFGKTEG